MVRKHAVRGITIAALLSILFLVCRANGALETALAAADKTPTFTISALSKSIHPDPQPFGIIIEPIRHVTDDSQFFFRTPEGRAALKALGVKTIFYQIDRNNWRAPYDDITAEPLSAPSAITPAEAVGIANALGAEFVPMVNVTLVCEPTKDTPPYSTDKVTCQMATPNDSAAFIRYLERQLSVPVKHVILGLEPYAGCQYWFNPAGIKCTMTSVPGQHRIGLPADEYVKRIKLWASAIHAVDRNIKIGAHVAPNIWDYCLRLPCARSWTQTVLRDASSSINFVLLHQYFDIPNPVGGNVNAAVRNSYYQLQTDRNKVNQGRTGMPAEMRSQIIKWAPDKKQLPIWYTEFNASIYGEGSNEAALQTRNSLYGGLALGELYLDLLAPTPGNYPGASRASLHHLFATNTLLGAHEPPGAPTQTMVFTPGWYILSSLQSFGGKNWLGVKASNVPKNFTGRASIKVYAARKGKQVTLALFNHEATRAFTVDLQLTNMKAKSVNITRVGEMASS
ncbi:MAG TPA: hypothetical protein VFD70_03380, partial [Anaerolineae bacterium]|nr:hypothetical protein [Anaerolineae bacterium]